MAHVVVNPNPTAFYVQCVYTIPNLISQSIESQVGQLWPKRVLP